MYKLSSLPEKEWINFNIASMEIVSNYYIKNIKII